MTYVPKYCNAFDAWLQHVVWPSRGRYRTTGSGGGGGADCGAGTRLCLDTGVLRLERGDVRVGAGRLGARTVAGSEMDSASLEAPRWRVGFCGGTLALIHFPTGGIQGASLKTKRTYATRG